MRRITSWLLMMLVAVSCIGCNQHKDPAAAKEARVSATRAFEQYFGPAPTTDKGTCYAFVIYFPSAKEPGKVLPFPFFTFDEKSMKKVALQRLITGMQDLKAYQNELLQPFAPGARLLGVEEKGGVVTVNLTHDPLGPDPAATLRQGAVDALVLTLRQFKDVKEVRLQMEGKPSPLQAQIPQVDERDVLPLGAPRLLSVTAMKEKGAANVEEVNAFFDRPVEMKMVQMSGPDRRPFQGDIYQSVFDMAGVMKPKDPTLFKAGMPVHVRWEVVDKLGRKGSGEMDLPLEVKEH